MSSKEIIVSIELDNQNVRVGKLWFHIKGSKESASFEYDPKWLQHPQRFALEPALNLTEGAFHTNPDMNLFGAIGDSAPDRWGRILMRREEASKAKTQKRTTKTLFEIDYLLGVNDEARQGALRFSVEPNENFYVSSHEKNTIPPLIALSKLLTASQKFLEHNESAEDLKLLLAPGSSLGGARPKACVRDNNGSLAIAKFCKKDDEFNIVGWEAVSLTLAKKAGIQVPEFRLEKVLESPVLIINRFDRQNQKRIPFLSAMSMLGAQDNQAHSYLEIVYALIQHGSNPESDAKELWRRIVFNIMISNTDDHLRNHAFIYKKNQGWKLSPAYDLNPTPREIAPHVLTTMIDFKDNTASIELALSVIEHFKLHKKEALDIIQEVALAVSQWKEVATNFGISKKECDRMASAFTYKNIF